MNIKAAIYTFLLVVGLPAITFLFYPTSLVFIMIILVILIVYLVYDLFSLGVL